MKLIDSELDKAERNSTAARQQLARTASALQRRLKPSVLARDAIDEAKEAAGTVARIGLDKARRNPIATAGAVAALALVVARKPLTRLFRGKPDRP